MESESLVDAPKKLTLALCVFFKSQRKDCDIRLAWVRVPAWPLTVILLYYFSVLSLRDLICKVGIILDSTSECT